MIKQIKDKKEITDESISTQSESNPIPQDILSLTQKGALSFLYIIITIAIVAILTGISLVKAPKLTGKILDETSLVNYILLVIIILLIFFITPMMIYDIFTNKFLMNIKYQIAVIITIGSLTPLLLGSYLAFSSLSNNQAILYLGIPPEILISALLISFVLYCFPIYLLRKLEKI